MWFWHQFPATLLDDEKQDVGGEISLRLAITVSPAFEPGQIAGDPVVQTFDREGVGFALDVAV